MKYSYPIIIEFDKEEKAPDYLVSLPDFDKMTQAESIAEAIEMGEDLLSNLVIEYEDKGIELPAISDYNVLKKQYPEAIISFVVADSDAYRRLFSLAPTKKTLSIPTWLNTKAEAAGINFSQTLQEALKKKLG